jgi:hypothetical protein
MTSLDGARFRRKSMDDVHPAVPTSNNRASQSLELIIFSKIGMEPMARKMLADPSIDPNEQTKGDGFTALLAAVQEGHHRIVDLLLKVLD